jgi:hypothetical protein
MERGLKLSANCAYIKVAGIWGEAFVIAIFLIMKPRIIRFFVNATLGAMWLVAPLWADVFVLKSGGEIQGERLNRHDAYAKEYEIRTTSGLTLRVPATEIVSREREAALLAEYERKAPRAANTIEAQWALAQWCLEHGLKKERRTHLENILQLDTNHAGARHALGYVQIRNRWQTTAEFHEQEGYQRLAGRWRVAQDVTLHAEAESREQELREWLLKLKRWRADLNSEKAAAAREQFESLSDPNALAAVQWLMRVERNTKLLPMYFDILLRMSSTAAQECLLQATLSAANRGLFLEGCERVLKLPPHLIQRPLLDALRSKENEIINRAAYLLGKTQDARVAAPLIEALVTSHRVATGENSAQTTTSFSAGGGIGMSRGGPSVVEIPVQNREVLEALVALTGQNFQYDQRAWRYWYDIEKARIFQ